MKKYFTWNVVSNVLLVFFTLLGFLLTGLKLPQYGLLSNLVSEVFWLYSSYRAWKDANQFGIFVTTVAVTCIIIAGVINYWFL